MNVELFFFGFFVFDGTAFEILSFAVSGSGAIPLSDFTLVDLTQVSFLKVSFRYEPILAASGSVSVSDIRTVVPEPSTASLLALGLVGIAAGRRRRAARAQ